MIVGCKLPHGLSINHLGIAIVLNGSNLGYDADNPWRNGYSQDSANLVSGVGLTTLEGDQAEAFKDWFDIAKKGEGPAKAGLIFMAEKQADAEKEARNLESEKTGLDGIDPDKDLPKDITTDKDAPSNKRKG